MSDVLILRVRKVLDNLKERLLVSVRDMVEKFLSFNVPIIPYTVNDINTAKRLAELNINTFITDEPKIF